MYLCRLPAVGRRGVEPAVCTSNEPSMSSPHSVHHLTSSPRQRLAQGVKHLAPAGSSQVENPLVG